MFFNDFPKGKAVSSPIHYWDINKFLGDDITSKLSSDEAIDKLDNLLDDAVKLQMQADVPLGVFYPVDMILRQ